MKRIYKGVSRTLLAAVLTVAMLVPSLGAAKNIHEQPSAGAMVADAVVARPLLLVTTLVGAGIYVVSLPFSLLGGNAEEAAEALVIGPAQNTFIRCLGCRNPGYQK